MTICFVWTIPLSHCFPLTITKSKQRLREQNIKISHVQLLPVSWIKHFNKCCLIKVLKRAHWHENSSPHKLILRWGEGWGLSARYSNEYRWNGRTCWGLSGEDRKVHRCQSQRSRVSILGPCFMPGHTHPRDFKWKSWQRIIVLTGG